MRADREARVNSIATMGQDMGQGNPINILTMTETDSKLFGISKNKLRRKALDDGITTDPSEVDEAISQLQSKIPVQLGMDWLNREYNTKQYSIDVALDLKDATTENVLQDAYTYCGKYLDDNDKKRSDINRQLKEERAKPNEERSLVKERSLYTQLSSMGKTYTDEDGNVIDPEKATPEQTDYMKLIDKYYKEFDEGVGAGETDEDKLAKAFVEQYSFVKSLDELYESDVLPWQESMIKQQAGPTSFGGSKAVMPEQMKNIVDRRRDASAKLAALSKLYLANESPSNVRKNIKYHLQSSLSAAASGLIGQGAVTALKEDLGQTERDMLDAAQSIMYSKGLPVPKDIEETFDRSLLEYANETASSVMGILPIIAVAGGVTSGVKMASGLDVIQQAWKTGNAFQKAAASMIEPALAEIQFLAMGSAPGTGVGFGTAMQTLPKVALKNPIANAMMQFVLKPTMITSGMLAGRVVESGIEAMSAYKPFEEVLAENFGDDKELAGLLIGNFMFGFGHKTVPPSKYPELEAFSKKMRDKGNKFEADFIDAHVKAFKKADQAAEKVNTKGMSEKEAAEARDVAADQALAKELSTRKEDAGFKERVVAPEKVSIVLRKTQVVDPEGKPKLVYHRTYKVFNTFSKEPGMEKSSGSKANSRTNELTMFFEDADAAAESGFGTRTESRYLNFTNMKDVGNIRSLTAQKIKDLQADGFDGIKGWERINGEKKVVYAAFRTRGIVKAESVDPFKSHNAEVLRNWAGRVREAKGSLSPKPGELYSRIPGVDKAFDLAVEGLAKFLELSADVVQGVSKSFAIFSENIKNSEEYKALDPEMRAKIDKEIQAKLRKAAEDAKPGARRDYDLGIAKTAHEQAKNEVLPGFKSTGEAIAKELGAEFTADVKTPESMVSKRERENLADVMEADDLVRGSITVDDPRKINSVIRRLKKEGYSVSIKRVGDKESGRRGIVATKNDKGIGTEIQIHTKETLEAQRKADEIRDKYRTEGVPETVDVKGTTKEFKSANEETFTDPEKSPLRGKQYAILTAENPGGKALTPEENAARNEILIKELREAGFEPIPVEGHYGGNPEHSFIVPGMTDPMALEFGKRHGQESVLTPKGLIYQDGKVNPADLTKINFAGDQADYYSKIDIGGKEVKFSIPIDFDTKVPLEKSSRQVYEESMTESRRLYNEAYAPVEDVNLDGSPAKTALDRKMKALEIPVSQQKELKKSWTETKQRLLGELRGKNDDMKKAFKDYVKNMNLTGLNVKLRRAMLNRVNEIDFNKPKSLERAISYFDKIIDDATFRYNVIEYERTLNKLAQYVSPNYLLKKVNKIVKNKVGPTGLPLADELKSIRKDMLEGDWERAQDAINSMLSIYEKENRPFTDKELAHITRLNFTGLLNSTNKADIRQLQGALRDLKDIIKVGKTKAAARRMIEAERIAKLNQDIFEILDQKPGKPVQLDQHIATNERVSLATKLGMYVNWMQLDSWFTLLNKFSKWDKSSAPYQSVINKVLGGAVVEADVNEYRAKTQKFTEVQDKFREIYGTNKDSEIRRISSENTTKLHDLKYNNLLGEPETRQMTMNQAYKVYMELQDLSLSRANEAGGWMRDGELTSKGEALMNLLTPEAKAWADWQLNEFYPKYYDRINEVYRRIYGTDMPMNEKYSPIFVSEKVGSKQGSDVDSMLAEETVLSAASNGNLKTRTNHNKQLALIDGDKVLTNYIEKMEYFINWSDAMQLLNSTLVRNGDIRAALRQNFGPASLKVIDSFMTDFSRAPKDLHRVTQAMDNFRKNFTVASLAIKPTVFFAQLTALPAYMEQVPIAQYAKYFAETAVHWIGKNGNLEIFDYIKNDPFWKERYMQGWDRDVIDSMQKDLMTVQGRGGLDKFKDMSMFLTKYGDMGAILIGGIPLYRYEYERAINGGATEREARARAMASFTDATRNSQQAGQVYDLSVIQRANSFTKILTMYKTSPFQYHRKVAGAFRDLTHGRGSATANLKTLAIYHVLLPQLFQMVGNGFKWDKEEQLQALVLGNFNEIFIAGDILKGIQNTLNGLPFAYQMSPIESTGKSAQQAAQHLKKANIDAILKEAENVSMPDLLKAVEDIAKVTGDLTGTPMRGLYSIGKGVYDVAEGELEDKDAMHKVLRIMGWSEYALEAGSKSKFDDEAPMKVLKKAMTDDKTPTLHEIYDLEDKRVNQTKKPVTPAKPKGNLPKF